MTAKNGSNAVLSPASPYSGHHSLLMQTTTPVRFPPEGYNDPDYAAFIRSANGGSGGGMVEVLQTVPVVAGHRYSVRYHYRCEDFQPERKQPGHPRGYVAFGGRVEWRCTPPHRAPADSVGSFYDSAPEWQRIADYRGWDMARPYRAPEDAKEAIVIFALKTFAEGRRPKVYIDDVEFVDLGR